MPSFDDIYEYENKTTDEDSMFNDDQENMLIGADQDEEETSIRELDFNKE